MDRDSTVLDSTVEQSMAEPFGLLAEPEARVEQPPAEKPLGRVPRNLSHRVKAYELFAAGVKKTDIARELGVNKTQISRWAKQDCWDDRFANIVRQAETTLDLSVGDQVSAVLITLRKKLARRIEQLEFLCSSASTPATRLAAIALWFKLAGIKQAIPDPTHPETGKSLELIQDLIDDKPALESRPTKRSLGNLITEDERVGNPLSTI